MGLGYHINEGEYVQICTIDTDYTFGETLARYITTQDDSLRVEEVRLQTGINIAKLIVRSLEPISAANLKMKLTYLCDKFFE